MDKAKKMAEQAQQKLDDVQRQINEGGLKGALQGDGPVTEYDQHGRPLRPAEGEPRAAAPAPAPPVVETPAAPVATPPATPAAAAAPTPEAPPVEAPAASAPAAGHVDRSHEKPPTLTSGDPLAG